MASVSVTLPGGPADLDFVQLVVAEENRRQRALDVNELLALAHVWRERVIDTPTAAVLTQQSDAEARAALESLVETGLLERRGDKKGRLYMLSAGVYRAIGKPAAYVRARGFEPEQMEQMILQFARAHGRISRKDVAELCRVDHPKAYRLLTKLVKEGKLVASGPKTGRNAFYVPTKAR